MKYFFSKYALTGLMLLSVLAGCKKEYESIEEQDERDVKDYLQQNNLVSSMAEYGTTGIYYQILSPGTGAELKYTDQIFMTYSIKSFDGKANYNDENLYRYSSYLGYLEPKTSNLPEAFRIAIKDILKKNGGSIRFIIPSRLAYGRSGVSAPFSIEGNQSLDCTIKLYGVTNLTDFEDIFVQRYIQANSITGLTKIVTGIGTGLYYKIITPGTGTEPVSESSTVTTIYTGKLTNGAIFDQNDSTKPMVSVLGNLIMGWQQGLPFIKKGGKIRLIIPPSLGYGPAGSGSVPPNSTLDFEIELTEVAN